jgi:hypothetical protein
MFNKTSTPATRNAVRDSVAADENSPLAQFNKSVDKFMSYLLPTAIGVTFVLAASAAPGIVEGIVSAILP